MADAWFADSLQPAPLPSELPPLMAPLPGELPAAPKPRALDFLAGAFGAGPDRVGAFKKGMDDGSQYRLRSAQTESALQEAEKRRQEALREAAINDVVARMRANPDAPLSMSDILAFGTGAGDVGLGQLRYQEHGFRDTLADPLAAPIDQMMAGQGVQGRLLPQIETLGAGREINLLDQNPYTNPIGEAQIRNYNEQPAADGSYSINGIRYNRDGTPKTPVAQQAADAATVADATAAARAKHRPVPSANMPAAIRNGFLENNALIDSIDATIEEVRKNPGSFGLPYALGDTVNQRLDPKGVAARAMVANIGSAKLHDRTGATLAAAEAPRLTPFIPTTTDRSDSIITKLEKMREEVALTQDGINAMYRMVPAGIAAPGGAAPAAPVAAPAAGAEPAPKTQAEYDALAPGTVYVDTDGQRKRKK